MGEKKYDKFDMFCLFSETIVLGIGIGLMLAYIIIK